MQGVAGWFLDIPDADEYTGSSPLAYWRHLLAKYGNVGWDCQEPSGSVANATNKALGLGRDVALNTYADYVAGANWSNPSGELARHAAGSVETLQQDDILAPGKTYQATVVISNRNAGSVTITDGGAAIAVNGTTLRTITSTGEDFIITPTPDFDGDIDVAITLVQQTNILADTDYPGAELLVDGDMEAINTSAWTAVQNAILSKETTNPHGGTRLLRVTVDDLANPQAKQSITIAGRRYRIIGYARSDGSVAPRARSGSAVLFTGTTSTDWQPIDKEFISASTNNLNFQTVSGVATKYTEWDDASVTEVNPLNGDHTGVTVGQPIGPGPLLAGSYDNIDDYTNLLSAELNSMLTPNTSGQVEIYAQVSGVGVWTDNNLLVLLNLEADVNNYFRMSKNTSNELQWDVMADGTLESVVLAVTPLTPFLMTLKWNVPGVGMRAFYNGALTGSAHAIAGTFVGNLTTAVIGALNTTPTNVWDGLAALVSDYRAEASDAETKRLAQLLKVYNG